MWTEQGVDAMFVEKGDGKGGVDEGGLDRFHFMYLGGKMVGGAQSQRARKISSREWRKERSMPTGYNL